MALGQFSWESFSDREDPRAGWGRSLRRPQGRNPLQRVQQERGDARDGTLPGLSFQGLPDLTDSPVGFKTPLSVESATAPTPKPTPLSWDDAISAPSAPGVSVSRPSGPSMAGPDEPVQAGTRPIPTRPAVATPGGAQQKFQRVRQFQEAVQQLRSTTDPRQQAVARDRLSRDLFASLKADGHQVKWKGDQLVVDGRVYDVGVGTTDAPPAPGASPAGVASQTARMTTAAGGPPTTPPAYGNDMRGGAIPITPRDAGQGDDVRAQAVPATRPTPAPRVDPKRTGTVEEATNALQTEAQRILGRRLTQEELNAIATKVGYTGTQGQRPTPQLRPPGEAGPEAQAISYIQQEAQRMLGRQLSPQEIQQYAASVGYNGGGTVTAEQVNLVLQQIAEQAPLSGGGPGQVTGDMYNRALDLLEAMWTDPDGGSGGAPGPGGPTTPGDPAGDPNQPPLPNVPRHPQGEIIPFYPPHGPNYVPGDIPTDDLEGFSLDDILGHIGGEHLGPGDFDTLTSDYLRRLMADPTADLGDHAIDGQTGDLISSIMADPTKFLGDTETSDATRALALSVLQNPESLSPHVVEMLKGRTADELAEAQAFEDEELSLFGHQNGIADSNWLASERAATKRDRQRAVTDSNRNIDIAAAETNMADRRAAADLGMRLGAEDRAMGEARTGARERGATLGATWGAEQFRRGEARTGAKQRVGEMGAKWARDQRELSLAEQQERRAAVQLAADTSLQSAALRGDRYALREQIHAKAAELGLQADQLQVQFILGQMNDLTQRYGIDVGATIDRERLAQQSLEFKEELMFRFQELRERMRAEMERLAQEDAQFGHDLAYRYKVLEKGQGGIPYYGGGGGGSFWSWR